MFLFCGVNSKDDITDSPSFQLQYYSFVIGLSQKLCEGKEILKEEFVFCLMPNSGEKSAFSVFPCNISLLFQTTYGFTNLNSWKYLSITVIQILQYPFPPPN